MATQYILLGDILYKSHSKLYSDPYIKCLGPNKAKKVMQEIHDGKMWKPRRGPVPRPKASIRGTIGPRCSMMLRST